MKQHSVQHRQEREDRKAAKKSRELRQKVKQLERTVARQQKLIDKLQGVPEDPAQEPAAVAQPIIPPLGPSEPAARGGRPIPATTGALCCDEPDVRDVSLIGRNYRVCRNCQARKRVG